MPRPAGDRQRPELRGPGDLQHVVFNGKISRKFVLTSGELEILQALTDMEAKGKAHASESGEDTSEAREARPTTLRNLVEALRKSVGLGDKDDLAVMKLKMGYTDQPGRKVNSFERIVEAQLDDLETKGLVRRGFGLGATRYHALIDRKTGELWNNSLDEWGNPLRPANLNRGVYKGGRRPIDLYWRIAKGINGAKMPAHYPTLEPEQIWDLVNFVLALPYEPDAARGRRTLPGAVADPARRPTAEPVADARRRPGRAGIRPDDLVPVGEDRAGATAAVRPPPSHSKPDQGSVSVRYWSILFALAALFSVGGLRLRAVLARTGGCPTPGRAPPRRLHLRPGDRQPLPDHPLDHRDRLHRHPDRPGLGVVAVRGPAGPGGDLLPRQPAARGGLDDHPGGDPGLHRPLPDGDLGRASSSAARRRRSSPWPRSPARQFQWVMRYPGPDGKLHTPDDLSTGQRPALRQGASRR